MRDRLVNLAVGIQHWVGTPLRWGSDGVYGFLWDLHWWILDQAANLHNWLESIRNAWPWNLIPGWGDLLNTLEGIADNIRHFVQSSVDRFIGWFNDHWNHDAGTWQWIAEVDQALDRAVQISDIVGRYLDRFGADPIPTILGWFEGVMHHVGWGVGYVVQLVGELDHNPFADIIGQYPNWWDRLNAVFSRLATATSDRLGRLWDRVWSTIDGPLNAVGNALGALESIIRGAPPNRWPEVRGTGSYPFAAIETMGHLVAQAVRDRIAGALQDAKDWAAAWVASSLQPVNAWIAGAQDSIDWVRGHAQGLGQFLANPQGWLWGLWWATLWPTVERWLADVWDGNA